MVDICQKDSASDETQMTVKMMMNMIIMTKMMMKMMNMIIMMK